MAGIEYSGAARRGGSTSQNETLTGLFRGITFWLSRQVPSRSRYRDDILENGGTLTEDEIVADMKIYDHARKTTPTGTFSYTFIDASIRAGSLVDKDAHRAGVMKGVVRTPGDSTQPTRRGKANYTKEEDCIVWDFMTKHLDGGGTDGGNLIYQQIEQMYPRHTYHSWRDRWLKYLKGGPRPMPLIDGDPTPPALPTPYTSDATARREQRSVAVRNRSAPQSPEPEVVGSEDDSDEDLVESLANLKRHGIRPSCQDEVKLFKAAANILQVSPDSQEDAWEIWASEESNTHHSAADWKLIWELHVHPIVKKLRAVDTSDVDGAEPATAQDAEISEAVGSSSQRAKANSSRRITNKGSQGSNSQTTATNSQSSASQQTSQETDSQPVVQRKRKRGDQVPGSDQPGSSAPDQDNSHRKGKQPQSFSRDQGEGEEIIADEPTSDAEDATLRDNRDPPSPSLTEPSSRPKHHQNQQGTRPADRTDKKGPSQDSEEDDLDLDEPRPKAKRRLRKSTHRDSTPVMATADEDKITSSFVTTPPGNTAKQYVLSPTPRRRAQQPHSSSDVTTTTPGNTQVNRTEESSTQLSQFEQYYEKYLALNISSKIIDDVLGMACGELEVADEALQYLHRHKELPTMAGLWPQEDDDMLIERDPARRKELKDKHGQEGVDARVQFLEGESQSSD